LLHEKNTHKNHRTSFRTEVEFPRSVQLVARIKTLKNHRTLFRTDVESFVHQDARHNMEKNTPLRKCKTM